ncbi:hypothetical protein [Bradyrhizobium sp. 6(2017)]|uniref:hypothetical protein n=1 Tax=Bradyrhizobium sp. 6(2017) TaxID=1197460 RepID=UPI0013E1902E|nr:hypothetical protein [Bradyrhizobium sp. 6(2017)]QIG97527.1 hypothetical protein G6P99_37560 [Bradyrhizobium sp. 6(2017)]
MKPNRHPLASGPGHRTPQTRLLLDERDALLVEAAARFYPGLYDRDVARRLHSALLRYRTSGWRRDCSEATCPPRIAGRLDGLLWAVLKVRDTTPPSERTIRRALSLTPIRGPAFGM